MNMDNKELPIDDIDEQYRWVAELIGVDNLIALCENAGGIPFHIPQIKTLFKTTKYSQLIEEFNGYNFKDLAIKYEISERTVRRLAQPIVKKKRNAPFAGQITIEEVQ